MRSFLTFIFAVAVSCQSVAEVAVTHTFSDNSVAKAAEVNQNFKDLADALNAIQEANSGVNLLTGSGAPAPSLGDLEDVYIDTTNYFFFGPKTANG